jgi:peptidoglycan/LPS O-acetylase OafA/YrhL
MINLLRLANIAWVNRYLGELACLLTITVSTALWYFVDRPIDSWRHHMFRPPREPESEPSLVAAQT